MKTVLLISLLAMTQSCTVFIEKDSSKDFGATDVAGVAYLESCACCTVLAGKYGRGDSSWDKKNQEWLDSDSNDPYPKELNDVDGRGYEDSIDCASNDAVCLTKS